MVDIVTLWFHEARWYQISEINLMVQLILVVAMHQLVSYYPMVPSVPVVPSDPLVISEFGFGCFIGQLDFVMGSSGLGGRLNHPALVPLEPWVLLSSVAPSCQWRDPI